MRIAAISDIHGNLEALRAVLTHIAAVSAPDLIVNLGDHVSGPLQPQETADLLMNLDHLAIRGNHDRQVLDTSHEMGASDQYAADNLHNSHRAWLANLPPTAWAGDEIFLCHGTPASDLAYLMEDVDESGSRPASPEQIAARIGNCAARVIVCGHTHLPRAHCLSDNRLIVNPGSVGVPAYQSDHPYPHKMEAGTPHARYAVLDHRNNWQVEFIQVEYDWDKAARLAAERQRPDWAIALKTGRAE